MASLPEPRRDGWSPIGVLVLLASGASTAAVLLFVPAGIAVYLGVLPPAVSAAVACGPTRGVDVVTFAAFAAALSTIPLTVWALYHIGEDAGAAGFVFVGAVYAAVATGTGICAGSFVRLLLQKQKAHR